MGTPPLRLLHFPPPSLGKDGAALVGLPDLLEEHEILQGEPQTLASGNRAGSERRRAEPHDQEAGPQQHRLHLHVHVQRELDPEVVGVGEDLLQEAAPLLADASDGLIVVFALQLQSRGNSAPLRFRGGRAGEKTENFEALTSKLTSPQQLQAKQGPSSFRSVSLLAPWMEKRGRKGCQSCLMNPIVVPGGAWTSICGHTHTHTHRGIGYSTVEQGGQRSPVM